MTEQSLRQAIRQIISESYMSFNPDNTDDVRQVRWYALTGIKKSFDNSARLKNTLQKHVLTDETFMRSLAGNSMLVAADKAVDKAVAREANHWSEPKQTVVQENGSESSRLFTKWWASKPNNLSPQENLLAREAWEIAYRIGQRSGKRNTIK